MFYLINSYASLFYIAFFRDYDGYSGSLTTNEKILTDLRIQLASIFVTMIVVQNATELVLNDILNYIFSYMAMCGFVVPEYNVGDIHQQEVLTRAIEDADMKDANDQIARDPAPELLDQMAELVIQYGYITFFVIVFPVAPLLALMNNFVEIYVDTKQWREARRPIPTGATGIGEWNSVLFLFSLIGVITNTGIIAFRTDSSEEYTPDVKGVEGDTADIWFFTGALGILYGLILLVRIIIPDAPSDIAEHLERSDEIEKYLVMKATQAVFIDPGNRDQGIKPEYFNVSTKDKRKRCKLTAHLMAKHEETQDIMMMGKQKRSPESVNTMFNLHAEPEQSPQENGAELPEDD